MIYTYWNHTLFDMAIISGTHRSQAEPKSHNIQYFLTIIQGMYYCTRKNKAIRVLNNG